MSKGKRNILLAFASTFVVLTLLSLVIVPALNDGESASRQEIGRLSIQFIGSMPPGTNMTILGSPVSSIFIHDALSRMTSNLTFVSSMDQLSATGNTEGVLFVDCDWVGLRSEEGYVDRIGQILLTGKPIVLVNDTIGLVSKLVKDRNVSWVGANSTADSPIIVRGLIHDPAGGLSASIDFGGKIGDEVQMAKGIRAVGTWAADHLYYGNLGSIVTDYETIATVYVYSYYSGDLFEPYGSFAIINSYNQMKYNGSSERSWYFAHCRFESDPGYGVYNNSYRTMSMDNGAVTGPGTRVYDYGPSTVYGTDEVGVYLDIVSSDTLGRWSYSIRDVTVLNHGNVGENRVHWSHELNAQKSMAKIPYIAEPGYSTFIEGPSFHTFREWYDVTWGRPSFLDWERQTGGIEVQGQLA